jgi:hypothetical protein
VRGRRRTFIADPALDGGADEDTDPTFERTAQEFESRIGFLLPQLIASANKMEDPTHA